MYLNILISHSVKNRDDSVLEGLTRAKDLTSLSRLRRFVKSGLCPAENAQVFSRELKALVGKVVDKETVRRESRIFKALSDPTRLKMVRLLKMREMCVCEIMTALEATQPTTSHHLNILEKAGLLKYTREGKWVFYSLANPRILDLVSKITSTTE
jgi:ArsR family transcriptional regulator